MEQTKNIWTPTPTGLYVNIVPVRNRYSHQAFPIGLCYAKPVSAGTITINEIAQEVAQNTTYERSTVKAIIEEMEEVIKRNVLRGFRCQIGEDFLTVYPNIKASVSDTDPEKVSAKQVTAREQK